MNKLVICGDSFNAGIGCTNLLTQPYGVLVAEKLGLEPIFLARGSSSNYVVYLQAMWAIQEIKPEMLIIGITSHDRTEWIADNKHVEHQPPLRACNINYHQYPPHLGYPGPERKFYFDGRPEYDPKLLSEQIGAFDDYLAIKRKTGPGCLEYYKRLHTEPVRKIENILEYHMSVSEYFINRDFDVALIFAAYTAAKHAGIKCKVLYHDLDYDTSKLFDSTDLVEINWGTLTQLFPDTIQTGHCSEEAHVIVAQKIIDKCAL